MSLPLSGVVLAALSLVCPAGAVPHAQHQGIALEVSAGGDLRHMSHENLEMHATPLMRTESRSSGARARGAAASLAQAPGHAGDSQALLAEDIGKAAPSPRGSAFQNAVQANGDVGESENLISQKKSRGYVNKEAIEKDPQENELGGDADTSASLMLSGIDEALGNDTAALGSSAEGAALIEAGAAYSFFPSFSSAAAGVGHKATDILYGMTGIGDDMDYPFACICGADGICVGDSMMTKCSGRAGSGSGSDG